jgi:hypothetical protein
LLNGAWILASRQNDEKTSAARDLDVVVILDSRKTM